MPKKTKIIFISVFLFVGALMLGIYFYNNKKTTTTTEGEASLFQKFNPFGSSKTTTEETPTESNGVIEQGNQVAGTSRFTQITDFAISGAAFFEESKPIQIKETATIDTTTTTKGKLAKTAPVKAEPTIEIIPAIRYTEKATGHVYQMYLDTKVKGKVSNTTIPNVYETIFNNKADSVIYRYVSSGEKTITSFLATLGGKSDFLNSDILNISLSPDKTKFFSIIKNRSGVTGIIKSFDGTKSSKVFSSSFSEWLPEWVSENKVLLTTKPSYLVDGSIFALNTTSGTLSKIFGGIKGLTTLSNNDATLILYGASLDNGPKLNIFNTKEHTSKELEQYGLPEKCIWSKDNISIYCALPNTINGTQYPDYWYQGLVSFDDFFVKINTTTGEISTLANSKDGTTVDAINLFLSSNEDKLFFTNKKDYTLWQLDL